MVPLHALPLPSPQKAGIKRGTIRGPTLAQTRSIDKPINTRIHASAVYPCPPCAVRAYEIRYPPHGRRTSSCLSRAARIQVLGRRLGARRTAWQWVGDWHESSRLRFLRTEISLMACPLSATG